MDEWNKSAYLGAMLGRFLTCLALLTGLAAFGAPANASVLEALNCEIGVAADTAEDHADDRRPCREDESSSRPDEADRADKPAKRVKRVLRPPVLFGIDRAYE